VKLLPASNVHRDFVRRLSAEVFARFGDYEVTLPEAMGHAWVRTVVAAAGGVPAGFVMYSLEGLPMRKIELLAIAVSPDWQSRGIGRRLLVHVENTLPALVAGGGTLSLQLDVAEDNTPALRLFESAGYGRTNERGHYLGGQRSVAMRKDLRLGGASSSAP
jgi:ribosomal-protein-alanine N-acetyltransferase